MLLGISIFLGCAAAVFAMIALHECGHFFAGMAAGIPADQMKIRLLVFPQHVALRDGEDWLSPTDYHRYVSRSQAILKDRKGLIAYVSGGLLVETTTFIGFVWMCRALDMPYLWQVPLTIALASLPMTYLVADILASGRARHPCGDFSGLWKISRPSAALVTAVVIISHAGLLWYVLQNA